MALLDASARTDRARLPILNGRDAPEVHRGAPALSGRVSLIDLPDEVPSSRSPLAIPSCSVYARLADAIGFYAVTLDVVRRTDLLEVARVRVGDFDATDPVEDGAIMVHQVGLRLPSAGSYAALARRRGEGKDAGTHLAADHAVFVQLRLPRYVERAEQLAAQLGIALSPA